MKKRLIIRIVFVMVSLLSIMACAVDKPPKLVAGDGSMLSVLIKTAVAQIDANHPVKGCHIQISPNNFWERESQVNLPFSSILSDSLAAELSENGAVVTVQETGENPLKLVGSYARAGRDILVIIRLRRMGDEASQDLAVVQGTVSRSHLDSAWLEPKFDRMARTLVRLLESDYTGMQSLILTTRPFMPANAADGDLVLGGEVETYITHALASSYIFQNSGDSFSRANARLIGEYRKVGNKMVFHAAVQDRYTGQKLCGSSFETPMSAIPSDLLKLRIQSLDDLAEQTARALVLDYGKQNDPDPGLVFIGKHSFADTRSKAMVPISLVLAEKFKTLFSQNRQFTVTDDPSADSDLILSGKVLKGEDGLTLSVTLDKMDVKEKGISFRTLAAAQEKLDSRFCREHWFEFEMDGKIDFFLRDLVAESLGALPNKTRAEVLIHKFRHEDTDYYSKFSDILNTHILDYFSGSRFFVAVHNPEDRMDRHKNAQTFMTSVAPEASATVAALVNAPYFIQGSFWPNQRGGVDISASLASVDGKILSSASTTIPAYLTDRDLLKPVVTHQAKQDLETLSGPGHPTVELLTQKGRHNLSFKRGEQVDFFVRSSRDLYLKIFTMDADKTIFRIFPNQFTGVAPRVKTGRITAIPNHTYADEFIFKVDPKGSVGSEMVFAFASDQPLPELPGSMDIGFYGMTRQQMSVREIKQWFSEYADQKGARLFWDVLPILTLP